MINNCDSDKQVIIWPWIYLMIKVKNSFEKKKKNPYVISLLPQT